MDKTSTFESYRPLLFSIAYRMLGSVMEAEDMVQESYLRWLGSDATVDAPKAYLTTIVSRLCLDQLKSARRQRETYFGPWLPEPLLTAEAPAAVVDRRETISLAFLTLLEQLTPVERAVFVLREIFDEEYAAIARVIDKSESNCRQLFSRAKRRLEQTPGRASTCTAGEQEALLNGFMGALVAGDMETLTGLLARDVQFWSDGGGKVVAATRPLAGREKVLAFLQGIYAMRPADAVQRTLEVNGAPAWVIYAGTTLEVVMDFLVIDGRIVEIRAVRNPDKLAQMTLYS